MASKKRPSSKKKNTQTKKKTVQKKVTVSSPSIVVPEKETIKEVAKEVKPVKKEKVKKNKAPKKGYFDEVISSLRHIKDGKCESLRPNRLSPILTYEFLPYFIVIWLHDHGFYNAA